MVERLVEQQVVVCSVAANGSAHLLCTGLSIGNNQQSGKASQHLPKCGASDQVARLQYHAALGREGHASPKVSEAMVP